MTQYQSTNAQTTNPNPRALTPTNNPEIAELQKKVISLYMMIEKVRRDNRRLNGEIAELRNYIRNHK